MDISIKKIGESHDEATGLMRHEHGVYEGETKVGSAVVAVKDGRAAGLKVKGLKTKHMSPLMEHLKTTYGDQMAKAIVGSALPATGKKRGKKDQEIDLDHDRRRVKAAVMAMLGGGETPATPDGKVNLAKSLVGMAKYQHILPEMQKLTTDLVGREATTPHHDHAAFMVAHVQKQLHYARQHMLQESPSGVDRVRGALGMQPLHMKHLEAANTYLEAAKQFVRSGDRQLHKEGRLAALPEGNDTPANITPKGYEQVKKLVMHPDSRKIIPHALEGLRNMHSQSQKIAAAANPAAPPPADKKPRTSRSKKQAPKNDD